MATGIYSRGIWRIPHLSSFLSDACRKLCLCQPVPDDIRAVAVWGYRPGTLRAVRKARQASVPLLRLEDGFIRSLHSGVTGAPPLSLVVDYEGIYYDARRPSTLERLIQDSAGNQLRIAETKQAISLMLEHQLSKYNHAPDFRAESLAEAVLVVDQTCNDMSVRYGNADAVSFQRMLEAALAENPQATIWVKTHPDVLCGKKTGYLTDIQPHPRVHIIAEDVAPFSLLRHVKRVYVVTSHYGFEALLAGKPVVCFGQPWYAGWGITDDRHSDAAALAARRRPAPLAHLFAAAYLRYSRYVHPLTGEPGSLFDVIDYLQRLRTFHNTRTGNLWAPGLTLWKRAILTPFLKTPFNRLSFGNAPPHATACVVWGTKGEQQWKSATSTRQLSVWRMEDGFLRSVGLGSELHAPLSLVLDKQGIYYDATRPSDLERLLQQSDLFLEETERAKRLRLRLAQSRLCKYNLGEPWQRPASAKGRLLVLVPGQVEDDASLQTGAPGLATNQALLRAVRQARPDAFIVYKPHPDVAYGRRPGFISKQDALRWADTVTQNAHIIDCICHADEIHTMTSLCGFEGLMHEKKVFCYGLPFYAGWGLTTDTLRCDRRTRSLTLDELVYQTLIAYPTYIHPVSKKIISAEEAVEYLIYRSAAMRPAHTPFARYYRLLVELLALLPSKPQ
ncbi:capsular polysaccharide biosynthesis protein [Franconibacter helveticus]|uniref:capsular polysaccharide biosynthesis protein n=1 Tax=Franconibacter helveticus TaxID=357240 RepID=UPI0029153217|nr:capsular polysaccharide biosynthesis protein [Franconibacter helveticus]MDU6924750.1 capsular polysaccharide biosynthesis protein [Franconibacter helveticus]